MSTVLQKPPVRHKPLPPLPPLTVYCFGTGSSSTDKTVMGKLARDTKEPKFITEGVGAGGKFAGGDHADTPTGKTVGNKNFLRGMAFGVGTDINVDAAVNHIRDWIKRGGR